METQPRTFTDLMQQLSARKEASAKRASGVPAAPEKDPNDKGDTCIPTDPNATPAKQNLPANSKNDDGTPVLNAAAPAKTVEGGEKFGLNDKIAALSTKLRGIMNKAATPAVLTRQVTPNMPANDKKNDGTTFVTGEGSPGSSTAPETTGKKPKGLSNPTGGKSASEQGNTESMPSDKTEKGKAGMPKVDSKGNVPPPTSNANKPMEAAGKGEKKEASADEAAAMDGIDASFALKIAHCVLSFEDGRAMAQACIERMHGMEAADNLIKAASIMESRAQELELLENAGAAQAEEYWANSSPEEREQLLKSASVHEQAIVALQTDAEKAAYMDGAKLAAAMQDAGMMGDQEPTDAQNTTVTEQDVIAALDELVQKGEIPEQVAVQLLQEILGGGAGGADGGAPGGGMPPGADGGAPGGAAPAPMDPAAPPAAGGPAMAASEPVMAGAGGGAEAGGAEAGEEPKANPKKKSEKEESAKEASTRVLSDPRDILSAAASLAYGDQ